jgi:hypothetical protein
MDTRADNTTVTLATVMDYADAIRRVGAGQFTSRFSEKGQRLFASFYGAPFFALSRLAPEAIESLGANLLLVTPDLSLAADGGRWLSLYARTHKPAQKFNLTVCVPAKPPGGKAPKPLLFQPPQQVLIKNWRKHLEALDTPPEVLVFQPLGFDDLESATETFRRHAAGCKVLLSCHSLLDALVSRRLLDSLCFQTSDIIGFPVAHDEPQHHASGAWWFSAVVPSGNEAAPVDPDVVEQLKQARRIFHGHLSRAKDEKDRESIAAVYATRSTDQIEDADAIKTVRILPMGGICLETGRFFSKKGDGDSGFCWEEKVFCADLLAAFPAEDPTRTQHEDRLAVMLWLAKAMTAEARCDEPVLSAGDDAQPAGPATEAEVSAEPDSPPALSPTVGAEPLGPVAPESIPQVGIGPTDTPALKRSRLSRSAGTVNVLAVAAMLGKTGLASAPAFEKAKRQILDWLVNKGFKALDSAGNHHVEHIYGEVTIETDDQGIWAMRFDDRRSMEDGAIWRVEITLLGQGAAAIGLRMAQVRSSEDAPPPVASGVPGVVARIAQHIGLQDAGVALVGTAQRLKGSDALWFRQLLLNPHRSQPVIVVSGSVDQSADRLARRLAGVAHVVRIDNALSDSLIRSFGRDRSVYGNAVRLYRPGFTSDADIYQHPIYPLKGTLLPKWLANDLFEQACAISLEIGDLEERAPSFQTIRNLLAEGRQRASEQRLAELRRKTESIASSAEEKIGQLQAINRELEAALSEQKVQNKHLLERAAQADSELQATRQERNAALEEVRQLKFQISNQWNEVEIGYAENDDQVEYPDNWDDLETWVELYGQNRLVLHPKAAKAARESPFKDISLAYKAMDYLVRYYIPMRTRTTDDSDAYQRSKQALAELGLEESDVGTADEIKRYKQEYKRQYEGREVTLDRHLKRGVGFGGDFQFRLYFYYDDVTEKVLVGHLPTHLTNRLTHNG